MNMKIMIKRCEQQMREWEVNKYENLWISGWFCVGKLVRDTCQRNARSSLAAFLTHAKKMFITYRFVILVELNASMNSNSSMECHKMSIRYNEHGQVLRQVYANVTDGLLCSLYPSFLSDALFRHFSDFTLLQSVAHRPWVAWQASNLRWMEN